LPARSRRGLDGINFLMADVRDGVGPYLSIYLKGAQHWDAGAIGLAMGASSIAAAICQYRPACWSTLRGPSDC